MKIRPRLESLIITVMWLLLVLRAALPQGLHTLIGSTNLATDSSAQQIRNSLGPSDAGFYLEIALEWARFESIDFENQSWILLIWSPGLSIIQIPMLWLEKLHFDFFWVFFSFLILLWASTCYLYWRYISNRIGIYKSVALLILITFSWDFKYIFNEGILNSEGYSLVFLMIFLIGITYTSEQNQSTKFILKILLGFSLGISIWIRHSNDTYLIIIFLSSSFLLLFNNVRIYKYFFPSNNYLSKFLIQNKKTHKNLQDLNFISFVAILVTLPWRLIATFIYNGQFLQMSSASPLFSRTIWASPGSESAEFWEMYGSNWACKIDPETCSYIANTGVSNISSNSLFLLAVKAVLKNPFSYIMQRLRYFSENWIPSFLDYFSITTIIACVSLFVLILVIIKILQVRVRNFSFIDLIWLPIIFLQFAQLAVVHFESRYFITLRITSVLYLLLKTSKNRAKIGKKVNTFDNQIDI